MKNYIIPGLLLFLLSTISPLSAEPNHDLFDLTLDQLMNLTITTAGKRPEKINNIPANVSIVTRSDIAKYGYSTLLEILENIPGLYNIDNYLLTPGNFGTRGLWNQRSQNASFAILVNGVNQLKADDRSNPFSKITVPVESIDRIELIRGPMSVLYGNGASFGVLNIITNESKKTIFSVSGGSKDTRKAAIRTSFELNQDFKFTLDLSTYRTDGYDYKFSDFSEGAALQAQLSLIPSPDFTTEDRLEHANQYAHLAGTYKNFYFDLTKSNNDREFYLLVPALDEGTLRETETNTVQLGYKSNITNDLNIDIKGTYSKYQHDSVFEGIVPGKIGNNSLDYDTYEFELVTDYQFVPSLNLVTGIYYQQMSNYIEFTHVPLSGFNNEYFFFEDRKTSAIYSQAAYQASDKATIFLGYRYEQISEFASSGFNDSITFNRNVRAKRTNGTPRIALVYEFNNIHVLKSMYGESSRISNDSFEAELIKTYELNHIYKDGKIIVNSSLFYTTLENLLVRERDISGSFPEQSTGELETIGIESIINVNFTDSLSSELGATVQSTKNISSPNVDVAYSPKVVAHAKLAYTNQNTILSLTSRYVSSMETFYDFENARRIGNKISDYFVLDANYRINKIYKGAYVNLRVTNILDEEIRYPNNPESNGGSNAMNRGTLGPEREFMLTLGWDI